MKKWRDWPIKEIEGSSLPGGLIKIKPQIEKLYYRGEWQKELFKKTLAIVGSRRMTRYGQSVIDKFMPELVANKITVISGFMYGIDSEAHRQCVELGGKTIAVLGGGLDYLTPAENDDLYSRILNGGGLVISEYQADFLPTLWSFPQRNRIVAGLATLGVLVAEAGLKSGSLITARLGKKLGKMVWAVPGPINSNSSEGTNYLIKNRLAEMILSADEITEKKSQVVQEELFGTGLVGIEKKITEILKREESTIDELARILGTDIGEVSVAVSMLSMKNLIEEEAGKIYLSR